MRLSTKTLAALPSEVSRFGYDREAQAIGIVHFGIGGFHRAHQAWYTDLAMDTVNGEGEDTGWAICGVSLRSRGVSDQLVPQDGLYTLTTRSAHGEQVRTIGAVREVLFACDDGDAIVAWIADPACRIVSFTVTEKGYCRSESGDLDLEAAGDSFYPLLGRALARRARNDRSGVTLLSCDNLAGNGIVLARLMRRWMAQCEPDALAWYDARCTAPSSMIDRIVPRSTDEDRAALEERLGLRDEGAVFTEIFSQWVIEDKFANGRPPWENVGAEMVADVASYETAKLRMLNGAHSLLAYVGLVEGYEYVAEAMADTRIAALVARLMLDEARPTIRTAPGQDLERYAQDLMVRFKNPALRHRLAQIAMDGSQKLPQRWLDTVRWHSNKGGEIAAIREGFDAWRRHCAQEVLVDDPEKERLVAAAKSDDRARFLNLCFGCESEGEGLWPEYTWLRTCFE